MLKKTILLFVLLSSSLIGFAQIDLGIKGGVNTSHFFSEAKNTVAIGYHAGLWSTVKLAGIGIRGEILYSTKGAKVEVLDDNIGGQLLRVTNDVKLSYIDVPILLEFSPVPVLKLHLGPQFSFLVNDNIKTEFKSGSLQSGTQAFKDAYEFESLDVAAVLGIGLGVSKFDAGARYNIGLTKVSNFKYLSAKDVDFKNGVFQLYVGFKF